MRIPIDNLGKIGVIKDLFSADTPPEAWSDAQNVRMGAYGAEKFLGHSRSIGTESAGWAQAPYWLFYAALAGGSGFWIGAGSTKVYVRSATTPFTETEITRLAGAYAATQDKKWNGGPFGGAFILNNGVDEPQAWTSPVSSATKLVNLSSLGTGPWPSTYRCGVMRPFGRFLVAIDVTKSGTRYPQLVKWSHPADPGSFPVSWDPTNPAVDAGEYPLQDALGPLVEQFGLRDKQMLYTTDQVWQMSWVGGQDIMGFQRVLSEQGALAANCVARFKREGAELHAVLSGNDLYIHNGQSASSIITPQMRRWLFSQFDVQNYGRSFVVANPTYSEIWFCIVETGAEQPTLAVVWNWDTGAIGFRDLLKATSNGDTRTTASTQGTPSIGQGFIEDVSTETWASDTAGWNTDSTVWNARTSSPMASRLLMVDRSAGKRTFLLDNGYTFDTAAFTWQVERLNLAIIGRDRDGGAKNDTEQEKLLTEIWPRVEAPAGTQLLINVGTTSALDQPVQWSSDYTYTVGTDEMLAVYHSEKFLSFRFRLASSASFRMMGYALEVDSAGKF